MTSTPRKGKGKAQSGVTGDDEIRVSELNVAADLLDATALEGDFRAAVEYVQTSKKAAKALDDAAQRRLYGLFTTAQYGPAEDEYKPKTAEGSSGAAKEDGSKIAGGKQVPEYAVVEQWEAHLSVGKLDRSTAMTQYIDTLITAIPDYGRLLRACPAPPCLPLDFFLARPIIILATWTRADPILVSVSFWG